MTITNARNLQLHVSYNGMGNSECEVEIEKALNTTVHLSFQVMQSVTSQYFRFYLYRIHERLL